MMVKTPDNYGNKFLVSQNYCIIYKFFELSIDILLIVKSSLINPLKFSHHTVFSAITNKLFPNYPDCFLKVSIRE